MIAYTITSLAYVPYARVLARTYAQHHGGKKLRALVIDDLHGRIVDAEEPFTVLRLGDMDLSQAEVHRMAMLFGDKLIAVIKPWVFQHLLSTNAESVLYIDSDFMIFDSLEGMSGPGDGVILVPHLLSAMPRDGMDPDETTLLGSGMYNAGMFGVGHESGGFLWFLMERLRRECVFDAKKMRFNEQRWLDFVPSLFPYHVVRDPGVDVAYWNLHERPLSKEAERWYAGGHPLRGFHFSSFAPRARTAGGRYELAAAAPRVRMSADPLFAELCEEYRRLLYAEGLTDSQDPPFGFDMLPDGTPVYDSARELFRKCVLAADAGAGDYPPDPFDSSELGAFRAWADEQYATAGMSVPDRMSTAATRRTIRPGSSPRWLPTQRLRFRRRRLEQFNGVHESAPTWAVDLLDRMLVDEAGKKGPAGIEILPQLAGFVCHGPRAPLVPGCYRVTLEFDTGGLGTGMPPNEQALVVEAFVEGYAVGSCTATFADIGEGSVVLEVGIPGHLWEMSLLLGVELRVLTRGRLRAWLSAIVLEPGAADGGVRGSESTHLDWLPVMAGGNAGLRVGEEVATIHATTGVVVAGPNWRLVPGRYRVTVRTRVASSGEIRDHGDLGEIVATTEVVMSDRILAERSLTHPDLAQGEVVLDFVVREDEARNDTGVGVRVSTVVPIDAAVTSVVVDRFDQRSPVSESVA